MTEIFLETQINAPVEVCFRASLDVGLHLGSAASTGERVVAGRTSGVCELGDEITWEARHRSRIPALLRRPNDARRVQIDAARTLFRTTAGWLPHERQVYVRNTVLDFRQGVRCTVAQTAHARVFAAEEYVFEGVV